MRVQDISPGHVRFVVHSDVIGGFKPQKARQDMAVKFVDTTHNPSALGEVEHGDQLITLDAFGVMRPMTVLDLELDDAFGVRYFLVKDGEGFHYIVKPDEVKAVILDV